MRSRSASLLAVFWCMMTAAIVIEAVSSPDPRPNSEKDIPSAIDQSNHCSETQRPHKFFMLCRTTPKLQLCHTHNSNSDTDKASHVSEPANLLFLALSSYNAYDSRPVPTPAGPVTTACPLNHSEQGYPPSVSGCQTKPHPQNPC